MENSKNKRLRPGWVILIDILMVGIVLVVFSLFHHVLPRKGAAIAQIVDIEPAPTAMPTLKLVQPSAKPTAAQAEPSPTPSIAPGDFSSVFPTEDTGVDAQYSYQSNSLRVAVRMVQENGVTYYLADVWVKNISYFRTAFAGGEYAQGVRAEPVDMARENNAILAVTGDYYGARSKGIVIRNGALYRDDLYEDVCVLYADGTLATYKKEEFDLNAAIAGKAWQAWSFGPELLRDGLPIEKFSGGIRDKNPRCAVGYYEPGHYCLVVVDGRQEGYSSGLTLAELSALMYSLGCKTAYNLDGGATAQMMFQGEVINRPSGGGRESSDILCFGVNNE